MYGGFNGTETLLSQRDWKANITTLSGDFGANDNITGSGASLSITNNGGNSLHVFLTVGLTAFSSIDGFIFTAGSADQGGITNYAGKNILNSFGGGLTTIDSEPILSNLTFLGNAASSLGGAFYNSGLSPTLTNVTFTKNIANEGGAVYNDTTSSSYTNVTFSGNRANQVGGGMANKYANIILTNVTFSNNNALILGGGIYNSNTASTINNTIFYGNTAGVQNDIRNDISTSTVEYSAFEDYVFGAAVGCFYLTASPFVNATDPDGIDNIWMTLDDGLGLLSGSPCAGTGTNIGAPTTDIVGTPRLNPTSIGAYEAPVALCQAATTLFVDLTATGLNDGSSWTNAFTDLQPALDCADAGDTIWVAQGTYLPTEEPDGATLGNRNKAFHLGNKDVKIFGGFIGTETLLGQRNWQVNTTILSGDFNNDDVTTGGGSTLLIASNSENAYHVFVMVGLSAASIFDGFTISGGNANSAGLYTYEGETIFFASGGGLYNKGNSSPTLKNLNFSSNSSNSGGGGMLCQGSSSTLTDVIFTKNLTGGWGGGLYNVSSSPVLDGVMFIENKALDEGGGMNSDVSSSPIVSNSIFLANYASTFGGGLSNYQCLSGNITNSTFAENEAGQLGGGVYNYNSPIDYSNVTFSENTSISGGGIYISSDSINLTNVSFSANNASTAGGAIYHGSSSSSNFKNTLFHGNTSPNQKDIYNLTAITPTVQYSAFEDYVFGAAPGCFFLTASPFINAADPDGVDNIWMNADDGLVLSAGSPCVGTGTATGAPANDIIGVVRPNPPSIGAYEGDACMPNSGTDTQTACDSYTWTNGITYNANNTTALDTFTNVGGCDSVVTLNLTINNSNTGTDTQTACDSYTWTNGVTYTANNTTALDTFTNAASCDSVVTLNLTINNSNTGTDTQSACDTYTWTNGVTYTANNTTALDTFTNAASCDSVVTLNLTINSNTGTDAITACDSYTWTNGVTYTANNTSALDTFTNAASCDSIVTLNLTINNSNTGTDTQIACDSLTWTNGVTYTSNNTSALDTFTNAAGCDSVVTLNLTINNSNSGTDTRTACDSLTWIDGLTYTSSTNTPTFMTTNVAGCDSLVTLNLTISTFTSSTDTHVACDSLSWIDGNTYTSSTNTPTFTITNGSGCDSIITLNLTVNISNTGTDTQTACDSFTWIDGITYTANNNTATHTLTNAAGCDSVVTLNLTINNSNTGTDTQTACDSLTWIDGITYTSSTTTPTFTLMNAAGCDSVVTLNLTINNSNTGTDTQTACDSLTWIDGITYSNSTNTPTFTLTNASGCDSVVTLNLTINNSNTGTDTQTACDTYTWIDGNTYTASNTTATHTLTNAVGCDSVVTLNLIINNSNTGTDTQTACESYTWIDGNTYTASNNTVTHTLTNMFGCDSIVTLDLSILNVSIGIDVQSACESYTWIDGITYVASTNTETFTIPNGAANGCDSIVQLDLTINYNEGITYVLNECDSYTWVNGVTYTSNVLNVSYVVPGATAAGCDSLFFLDLNILSSGSDTDVIVACESYTWIDGLNYTSSTNTETFLDFGGAANGCDILMALDLTIIPIPSISIMDSAGTLEATPGLGFYQWYRNGVLLPGETSSSLTPTLYGGYTCITTNGSCDGVSNEIVIGVTSIQDQAFVNVSIYPNPTNNVLNINLGTDEVTAIRLLDLNGKIVRILDVKEQEFDMNPYARGMYFIELLNEKQRSIVKIVLN